MEKLNTKSGTRQYKHFSPHELIKALLSAGELILPDILPTENTSELFLCVFENQKIWVANVADRASGRLTGRLAWDAVSGEPISPSDAPDLSSTDYPFPEPRWLEHEKKTE